MRTLFLMRHAKSDWDAPVGGDHERPLNSRGRKAAALMGRFFSRLELAPDLVVSSTAVRARTTVELAAEAGGWRAPIRLTRELYDSSPVVVLEVARQAPAEVERQLLAGHEPVWSELAGALIGGGQLRMATATVAAITFEIERWSEIAPGRGRLLWLIGPRQLAGWEP